MGGEGGGLRVIKPHLTEAKGTRVDFCYPKPATSAFPPSHLLRGMERRGICLGRERQGSAKLLCSSQLYSHDVDDDAHARHCVPVHGIQHGLRDGFKQVFWILPTKQKPWPQSLGP